jgi:hypothetical protein
MTIPTCQPSTEDAEAVLLDPYELVSIRSVPAPAGATGAGWHRYEINQGQNKIVGYRDGGIGEVTIAVEAIVLQLNERRRHRRGRVHVVLQSRSGRAKRAAGK